MEMKWGEKIKMKIGIDLDDVVFEFTREFVKFYNERYGKEIKFEEVYTYDFPKVFDLPLQTILDLIKEMSSGGIVRNLPFRYYAKESILDLSKNHEIFFITSRVVIRERTLENLKQLFSEIEFQLIFSSNSYARSEGKSKAEICHEQGIDIMIEDDKGYAEEISKNGTKVLLLDRPWNRECQEHENITKVGNWREVREKIGNSEKNIIEQVRQFVEEEHKKPEAKYDYGVVLYHLIPVLKYSMRLGKMHGADLEILSLAAWLHDIGSIVFGREDHHITSSEIAEKKLRELNYPEEKIEQVKHCIFAHRGSKNIKRETIEAEILADADSMVHFDTIGGIFKAALLYENHTQKSAQEAVKNKLINSYNKLSSEAKKIIKPKYDAAMLLFNENDSWEKEDG